MITPSDFTPSDETISAWLDGEADDAASQAIEAALADDPALAERIATLRSADDLLRAAYPLDDSVPDAMLARLGLAPLELARAATAAASVATTPATANIIDFATARARVRPQPAPRRIWTAAGLRPAMRIAAQAALVVGLGGLAGWTLLAPAVPSPQVDFHVLGSSDPQHFANGLVMFRTGTSTTEAAQLVADAGAKLVDGPNAAGAWRIAAAPDARDGVLAMLRRNPGVALAAPIDGAGR